jgi:phosphatidylinositol alpha-mannosyltransferase
MQRVMSIGSTVTVLANNSRTHIVLSQTAELRLRRLPKRERFDLFHVHEPMTRRSASPRSVHTRSPVVGTWHATGELNWMKAGMPCWGMLMKRIDYRIAVSGGRLATGLALPSRPVRDHPPSSSPLPPRARHADPGGRENIVVYIGRHDPRKGLEVLLRAWPRVRRETDATLHVIGADPRAVRLLMTRLKLEEDGIELMGVIVGDPLTAELARAKLLARRRSAASRSAWC